MQKKSMIIKLHIQIANKQLNVYNNTIITLLHKVIYKKLKTDSLSLLLYLNIKISFYHKFRLFLTFSDFLSIKNVFRHRSCLSFAIIKALTKSPLLQSTNSRRTLFDSCCVLNIVLHKSSFLCKNLSK